MNCSKCGTILLGPQERESGVCGVCLLVRPKLAYRTKVTLANVGEEFAGECYRHGYGCVQLIGSYAIERVTPEDGKTLPSPYLVKRQEVTNAFIDRFLGD